jgi:selenocysteine-specific elongation factor
MHVIATAGHVDHGKSALVRALTGMEPDRWAEEIRRGMTIDLGFCWTTMRAAGGGDLAPAETAPTDVAFVDVPGHERYVANMLAGVGPAPAVLFVVAADEGWRAQSEEHLAAIDALGLRHGLLAVTRSDLADPAPAMRAAQARIARSSLGNVEAVAVSSVTGMGLDELRAAVGRLIGRLAPPDPAADVRLWVDRSFTITGHGTVVTGTLAAGTIRAGDELLTMPGQRLLRVRGLQALRAQRAEVAGYARVALNLRGAGPSQVRRGAALVTPGRWLSAKQADVRLRGLADGAPAATSAATTAEIPAWAMLHIGTAAIGVRVRRLGRDTARLALATPLPLRIGDMAALRDPGRQLILAGVTFLDVQPPALRRRGAARERAAELDGMNGAADADSELRRRKLVRARDLAAMGAATQPPPVTGEWLADPGWWRQLGGTLAGLVEQHAATHPLDPGLAAETARQRLGLPDRKLVEALVQPPLGYEGGKIYRTRAAPALPAQVLDAVEAIRTGLRRDPFLAPDADRLRDLGLDRRQLAAAVRAGYLLRVSQDVYLLPGADHEAARILAALPQPFTLSQARQALGTTRRVAVPLLEMLDRLGRTERVDEMRRRAR